MPRVDAVSLYRWNGLGRNVCPTATTLRSPLGDSTDWTLGVNFSVPLGLRQARAAAPATELMIARDRANLDQGLHGAIHSLALSVRNLDQFYEQYLAFGETRAGGPRQSRTANGPLPRRPDAIPQRAASDRRLGERRQRRVQSLAQYNTELAMLERQTGTILETHGVRFLEERYGRSVRSAACFPINCYPRPCRRRRTR